MSDAPRNYSPHQQKIIRRYYDNLGDIKSQRLAELVGELYLAEGKKKDKVWKTIAETMERLKIPADRIAHLVAQKKPELIADLVKELERAGQ